MLIGAISDTHDNLPMVKKAIDRMNQAEVSLVLHAGDITSPFTPKMFNELKPPMIVTYGNNDAERELLKKRFTEIGKEVHGLFAEVEVGGARVALTHGDEVDLLNSLIKTQFYHLLVYGPTHQQKSYTSCTTTIVNPGEVCGYLTGQSTAATIETKSRHVEILHL